MREFTGKRRNTFGLDNPITKCLKGDVQAHAGVGVGAECGCLVIDCLTFLCIFAGFNCLFLPRVALLSGYHLLYRIMLFLR